MSKLKYNRKKVIHMEVDLGLIAEILTIILLLLSIYFGSRYRKAKRIMKELAEAMDKTYKAIEDDKITKDELKQVIKEWMDVLEIWRDLL